MGGNDTTTANVVSRYSIPNSLLTVRIDDGVRQGGVTERFNGTPEEDGTQRRINDRYIRVEKVAFTRVHGLVAVTESTERNHPELVEGPETCAPRQARGDFRSQPNLLTTVGDAMATMPSSPPTPVTTAK